MGSAADDLAERLNSADIRLREFNSNTIRRDEVVAAALALGTGVGEHADRLRQFEALLDAWTEQERKLAVATIDHQAVMW